MKAQRALTEVETELSLALQNRTSGMLDVGRLLNEATHIESDGGRDRVGRERRFLLRARSCVSSPTAFAHPSVGGGGEAAGGATMRMSDFDRDRDQVVSVDVSVLKVMSSREFRVGIAEVRAGKPPRFDEEDDWNYERGRQFGIIAPANMDPRSDMAVRLFSAAVRRGYIV